MPPYRLLTQHGLTGDLPALTTLFGDLESKIWNALACRYNSRNSMHFMDRVFGSPTGCTHGVPNHMGESRRFSSCFVVLIAMYVTLIVNPQAADTIPPPNRIMENNSIRSWVRATYGDGFLPRTEPLSHGIAFTPLDAMSISEESAWTGYYFYVSANSTCHDPPMWITLQKIAPSADEPDVVKLRGRGSDRAGSFSLDCRCRHSTGLLVMHKAYTGHLWTYDGVVTPFGLVGRWGNKSGWWWIWPREWST